MRVLGLDVGDRWVGIAVSDPSGTLARPLQTLERVSREQDVEVIAALVEEHEVGLVVVGQPLNVDGSEGPQSQRTARYADHLADRLSIPVVSWDERFTTLVAEEIMLKTRKAKDRRRARSRGEIDAIAAAVILQSYLDSQVDGG